MVLKLERFSYLSDWSFGLGSPIGLGYVPIISVFIKSQCVAGKGYLKEGLPGAPREGPE